MNEEVKINRTCQLATAPASKRFVQLAAMVAMLLGGCTLPPRHEAPPLPRIPAQWSQVEAVAGAAGVALPWLVAIVANVVQHDLTVVVTWSALALAVGVASAIGIGFGFVPARQASHLSPLQALSRE